MGSLQEAFQHHWHCCYGRNELSGPNELSVNYVAPFAGAEEEEVLGHEECGPDERGGQATPITDQNQTSSPVQPSKPT